MDEILKCEHFAFISGNSKKFYQVEAGVVETFLNLRGTWHLNLLGFPCDAVQTKHMTIVVNHFYPQIASHVTTGTAKFILWNIR